MLLIIPLILYAEARPFNASDACQSICSFIQDLVLSTVIRYQYFAFLIPLKSESKPAIIAKHR